MIDKAEIDRLINDLHDSPSAVRLTRRAATALTALQSQLAAAEALLGAAYRAALEDAAGLTEGTSYTYGPDGSRTLEPVSKSLRGMDQHHSTIAAAIRALPVPADLAARLAKEAGE